MGIGRLAAIGLLALAFACERHCPEGQHWFPGSDYCRYDQPEETYCSCGTRLVNTSCVPCEGSDLDAHHASGSCELGAAPRPLPGPVTLATDVFELRFMSDESGEDLLTVTSTGRSLLDAGYSFRFSFTQPGAVRSFARNVTYQGNQFLTVASGDHEVTFQVTSTDGYIKLAVESARGFSASFWDEVDLELEILAQGSALELPVFSGPHGAVGLWPLDYYVSVSSGSSLRATFSGALLNRGHSASVALLAAADLQSFSGAVEALKGREGEFLPPAAARGLFLRPLDFQDVHALPTSGFSGLRLDADVEANLPVQLERSLCLQPNTPEFQAALSSSSLAAWGSAVLAAPLAQGAEVLQLTPDAAAQGLLSGLVDASGATAMGTFSQIRCEFYSAPETRFWHLEVEVLSISDWDGDGSSLQICRLVQLDEDEWRDLKDFLSASPGTAHALQGIASNAEALQGWLQLRAAAEHYQIKLGRNEALQHLSEALEADEELAPVFQDIRENGVQATLKYSDAALMVKISKKLRSYHAQWESLLQKLEQMPFPLHEVAKEGDERLLSQLLQRRRAKLTSDIDAQDGKGITALGYAVWAGHFGATKLLIEHGADPYAVDSCGNTCVHYAAGYGRKDLLEYLLEFGFSMHRCNTEGLTPMAVAVESKQDLTIQVLDTWGLCLYRRAGTIFDLESQIVSDRRRRAAESVAAGYHGSLRVWQWILRQSYDQMETGTGALGALNGRLQLGSEILEATFIDASNLPWRVILAGPASAEAASGAAVRLLRSNADGTWALEPKSAAWEAMLQALPSHLILTELCAEGWAQRQLLFDATRNRSARLAVDWAFPPYVAYTGNRLRSAPVRSFSATARLSLKAELAGKDLYLQGLSFLNALDFGPWLLRSDDASGAFAADGREELEWLLAKVCAFNATAELQVAAALLEAPSATSEVWLTAQRRNWLPRAAREAIANEGCVGDFCSPQGFYRMEGIGTTQLEGSRAWPMSQQVSFHGSSEAAVLTNPWRNQALRFELR
ncbi:unnamed protein product, partial [Effrenium voratum]